MKIIKPKYYLNKKLKPKKVGSVDTYPVYFRFTIGNNNHRIKSFLVGYLKDENQLVHYKKEIDIEKEVINYLFTRFHDYSFTNFNSDAFYLCSSLQDLISMYIYTYAEELEDQVALEKYKDELNAYLYSKTKFPKPFINNLLEDIKFESIVPSDFIKDKKLKLIIDTYNFSITFNKNVSPLFCMYNWIHTDIKEDFSKTYSSSHVKFIDKIVKLYGTALNSSYSDK